MITLKIAIKDNIIEIILPTNSNYVSYHDLSNKVESHTYGASKPSCFLTTLCNA
jgi:hypothetical protein